MYDSRAVGLGDLDNDGDLDAFVGNHNGYSAVWLSDEHGNMTGNGQRLYTKGTVNGRPISLGFYSHSVALSDLDGDGDLDAFVAQCCRISEPDRGGGTEPYNMVWTNDGSGQFTDSGQRLGPLQSHSVALGDVDGDGSLDVLVVSYDRGYCVWRNDGTGHLNRSNCRRSAFPRMVGAGVATLGVCLLGGRSLWRWYRSRGRG